MIVYGRSIEPRVIEAMPNLGMISCTSVGTDLVDHDVIRERGIWLANAPAESATAVAAHALAMALSLLRHLPFYDRAVRAGSWSVTDAGPLRRPGTLTFGIAGLGMIGRQLAAYAVPIFGRVVDYRRSAHDWPSTVDRAPTIDEVFSASDIVSLHLPLTTETEGLVDAARIARMRPGSYVVNVARGALIDMPALRSAQDSGHLAGAALDVLPQEHPTRVIRSSATQGC